MAEGRAELDSFDLIEGLSVRGQGFEVLNVVSLHGGLVASWPMAIMRAKSILPAMVEHWRAVGLPAYAQFDNDMRFQGPYNRPGLLSRIVRTCLSLGVTPVFVPPRETGFQAAIENYNGQWQAKVWSRFTFGSLAQVQRQSACYVQAHRARRRPRIEAAPARRPMSRYCYLRYRTITKKRASMTDREMLTLGHYVHEDEHDGVETKYAKTG
jgi:hypothetical protein